MTGEGTLSRGAIPAHIACIGAGNVGSSWAITFARAGAEVSLWDADPERAQAARQRALDAIPDARVTVAATLELALAGADYVQESIAEVLEAKRALFAAMEPHLEKGAILASSTSALPASEIFAEVAMRQNCLIAHPVNPPHLIPLVEISGAAFTSREVIERTMQLMQAIGQAPIEVRAEIEGFVLNRLQWALLGEALHLVERGYCSAEDIDLVLTHGLARRWVFYGPFATGHLNADQGLRGYFTGLKEAMDRVRNSLHADFEPSSDAIAAIHASMIENMPLEDLPDRKLYRDEALMQLNAFLEGRRSP